MEASTEGIERTLRELADIRRAIEWVQDRSRNPAKRLASLRLQRYIHMVLVALSAGWTAAEATAPFTATRLLHVSHFASYEFRFAIIAFTAVSLTFLAAALYVTVWRAARKEHEEFDSYLERNFVYLHSVSFLSDLFVKFVAVSIAILSGRGDWVAPLLLIFTGDYLFQGRLFLLPLRTAILLGSLCVLTGVVQLLFFYGSLLYPLIGFFIVSAISLWHIVKLEKRAAEIESI